MQMATPCTVNRGIFWVASGINSDDVLNSNCFPDKPVNQSRLVMAVYFQGVLMRRRTPFHSVGMDFAVLTMIHLGFPLAFSLGFSLSFSLGVAGGASGTGGLGVALRSFRAGGPD